MRFRINPGHNVHAYFTLLLLSRLRCRIPDILLDRSPVIDHERLGALGDWLKLLSRRHDSVFLAIGEGGQEIVKDHLSELAFTMRAES